MTERLSSLLDRLLGWCFAILLAALALKTTIHLICSIWPWIVGGVAAAGVVGAVGRSRWWW